MENAQRYVSFIKRILTSKSKALSLKLLSSSNLNIIKAIVEIIYNILQGNIKIKKPTVIKEFKKYKNLYSSLFDLKDLPKRKQFLIKNFKVLTPLKHVIL